mmetsp:Transcript_33662/g.79874  ORF Transcript_33662/g.79874 Transcript_33662/m.79874 type:complete len:844 (+) Transcript_33662:247-2778(+)
MADAVSSPGDEQDKWLGEARQSIKKHAYFMKKSLDDGNLREALKYGTAMLGELRTSLLSPQKYFELYMMASAELMHLEMAFTDEVKAGKSYAELYELVQHAGNVLPRMYLLCTVSSVYIKSGEGAAKAILTDLVEMCKGVQHPTRGLFLRSYLAQVSRDKLPDTGSPYEGPEGGNVSDAIDFVVRNFTEMNKLWVRMQHQGAMHEKERREKERQQLQDLVGKNLVLLSQLEGMDLAMYEGHVLPRIMEQVVSCKDDIAQQYLMDCMIQAFPDEFHVRTLSVLLGACPELQSGVKVHVIMSGLMNRLARYAKGNSEVKHAFDEVDAFGSLCAATQSVASTRAEMPAAEIASLYAALLSFAAEVHPDKNKYVNVVMESCCKVLEPRGTISDRAAEKQAVDLLVAPLDKLGLAEVLRMPAYPQMMALLAPATRKELCVTICRAMVRSQSRMTNTEDLGRLFGLIDMLIQDQPGDGPLEDDEDFREEQNLVARIVHLFRSDDLDEQMELLQEARKRFRLGGHLRLRHTLRPLCFSALRLVRQMTEARTRPKTTAQAVYKFLYQTIETLSEVAQQPEAAMQLLLQCALSASEVARTEQVAFQFMESAFEIFEEAISDSRSQIAGLHSIVGTLQRCYVFGRVNRETLVSKATAYSAKLLRKVDQCRALCACAHLHWQAERPAGEAGSPGAKAKDGSTDDGGDGAGGVGAEADGAGGEEDGAEAPDDGSGAPVRDGLSVLKTLKRALKTANAVQQQLSFSRKAEGTDQAAALFIDILNSYLFFFSDGCEQITTQGIQDLVDLVQNEIGSLQSDGSPDESLLAHYRSTVGHMQRQAAKEGDLGARFSELRL